MLLTFLLPAGNHGPMVAYFLHPLRLLAIHITKQQQMKSFPQGLVSSQMGCLLEPLKVHWPFPCGSAST